MHFHIIPKDDDGRGLGTTGKFWRSHPIDKATAPALAEKIAAIITGSGGGSSSSAGGADDGAAADAGNAAPPQVETVPAEGANLPATAATSL